MKMKVTLLIALAAGFVAPFALPAQAAADTLVGVMDWMLSLHIAELAVAANAFAMIP